MDMKEAMKLKPWEPRPKTPLPTHVERALGSILKLDEIADREDIHGRPMYTHEATGLDFHLHSDGRGWSMAHREEEVGDVRVYETSDAITAYVRPADESWEVDCEDVAGRLPSAWRVSVVPPGAAFAATVDQACRALATDDGRDKGRSALAEEVGVHVNTVGKWLRGESPCTGPAAKLVRQIVTSD